MIPDGAVITDEATLEEALSGTPREMPETGGVELEGMEGLPEH